MTTKHDPPDNNTAAAAAAADGATAADDDGALIIPHASLVHRCRKHTCTSFIVHLWLEHQIAAGSTAFITGPETQHGRSTRDGRTLGRVGMRDIQQKTYNISEKAQWCAFRVIKRRSV